MADQQIAASPLVTAYVAIGANLGDAAVAVRLAVEALGTMQSSRVVRVSGLYKTAPIESDGPDYFNAVAEILTTLDAPALLLHLQQIERRAGRERPYRNAPRTLDLDLLLFGGARIVSARLTVPHPRMVSRAFVLVPLAEIAAHQVTASQLAAVAHQPILRIGSLTI